MNETQSVVDNGSAVLDDVFSSQMTDGSAKVAAASKPKRSRAARPAPPAPALIPVLNSDDRGVSVMTLQGEGKYAVQFDFNRDVMFKISRLEGAAFSKEEGVWFVPGEQTEALKVVLESMRVEVTAGSKAFTEIQSLASDIAVEIQRANRVDRGVKPMISDYHGQGEGSTGKVIAVNSRFAAQYTGAGKVDGAAFVKLHRLSDLDGQLFAGDHAVITYGEDGRAGISRYVPQAEKVQRLEESMGKYVDGVKVTQDDKKFLVQFDYNPVLARRIGPIVGAKFDQDKKVWSVDVGQSDVVARAVYDMRTEVVADRSEREDLTAIANKKIFGVKVGNAYAKDGQANIGEVLARTDRYVLQHTGREYMAVHRVDELNEVPKVGQKVRIEYQAGKGRVEDIGQSRGRGQGR